ncbi:MAG: phosphate/phosphite/phosphonate ABC transporter substrate-binding protein [Nitrospirae bacterium]|nr:phosphate/phosphite/phosphonate ABC transporter substrate-binding protein [Nitrospirota bacterium]
MSPRKQILTLGVATAAAALILSAWWTARSEEEPIEVRLDSADVVPHEATTPPFRLAVTPLVSPLTTVERYEPLQDYLAGRLDRPVRLIQKKTYGEINELLRHGAVQAAVICTGALLRARKEEIPLDVVAVGIHPPEAATRSLIVVRADVPATSLADLRDRAFAFTDPSSLISHYYTLSWLLDHGIEPRDFFSRTVFTHGHDSSLDAVRDGVADAAAVNSRVFDEAARRDPSLAKALRVIQVSPPLGGRPVVVPASSDPALRERIRQVFLQMASTPEGEKTLDTLGFVRFDPPSPEQYGAAPEILAKVDAYLQREK